MVKSLMKFMQNQDNPTLYELAIKMSDNNDAQEGFPLLVKWLLNDFWNNYTYNGIPYSKEYAYNIAYFTIYNFINREICSSKPEVFRTKFLKEIVNMNLEADFYSVLASLKDATVELTKKVVTSNDMLIKSDETVVNDLRNNISSTDNFNGESTLEHNTTNTETTSATNTSTKDTTVNNTANSSSDQTVNETKTGKKNYTDTKDSTLTSNETTSDSGNETIRNVLTDYPQSTVDTTIANNWDYASGATDQIKNNSNSKTNTGTNKEDTTLTHDQTDNDTKNLTGKETVSGTGKTIEDTDITNNVSSTITNALTGTDTTNTSNTDTLSREETKTGNVKTNTNKDIKNDIDSTHTWMGMTGLELNANQIKLFDKYKSFYNKLLTRLENCFISVYVDEDRDGYLDPSVNLMSAWVDQGGI